MNISKQRIYSGLLILGGGILLFLTLKLLFQGAIYFMEFWVICLLIIEMIIDLFVIFFSMRWWITDDAANDSLPLRFGAAAAILHAIRVLVFVIGRIGPLVNFDLKAEYKTSHYGGSEIGWVWFAAIMSILGIIAVIVIWKLRSSSKRSGGKV